MVISSYFSSLFIQLLYATLTVFRVRRFLLCCQQLSNRKLFFKPYLEQTHTEFQKYPWVSKDYQIKRQGTHLALLYLSHAQFLVTPCTVAHQAPSVHGISQARILEWVVISFSRGSSQPRGQTHSSCIVRRVLYH